MRVAKIKISLSKEDFDELIELACYGCTHWVDEMIELSERTYLLKELEENKGKIPRHILSTTKIESAIAKVMEGPVKGLCLSNANRIRSIYLEPEQGREELDVEVADWIVQLAIFQEVIFG